MVTYIRNGEVTFIQSGDMTYIDDGDIPMSILTFGVLSTWFIVFEELLPVNI